jgi:hypothetical protein
MASLQEIRARLAAQDNKSQNKNSSPQGDGAAYPHWNMDEGSTASIRFLPDDDSKNEFFWVEKQIIKLPFNGVKGHPDMKKVDVQVPCMEMYNGSCPILAEVRPWYKDETLKEMANKYWKKRSYLFQGFVRQNPIGADTTPANPIRRFIISPQIIPIIKSGLMDPEIMELPTDYLKGLDFTIKKTSKGGYADYSTSNWSRRESALTEVEAAAIEAHGLFNLIDFLPKKPSEAELRIIKEMFEASVDGQQYDPERWGQYYRPWGIDAPSGSSARVAAVAPASLPAWEKDVAAAEASFTPDKTVVPVAATTTSSDKAADILAMIKARQIKS